MASINHLQICFFSLLQLLKHLLNNLLNNLYPVPFSFLLLSSIMFSFSVFYWCGFMLFATPAQMLGLIKQTCLSVS